MARNKKIIEAVCDGAQMAEVAREYGLSRERVRQICQREGVGAVWIQLNKAANEAKRRSKEERLAAYEKFRQQVIEDFKTSERTIDIMRKYDIPRATIGRWIRLYAPEFKRLSPREKKGRLSPIIVRFFQYLRDASHKVHTKEVRKLCVGFTYGWLIRLRDDYGYLKTFRAGTTSKQGQFWALTKEGIQKLAEAEQAAQAAQAAQAIQSDSDENN